MFVLEEVGQFGDHSAVIAVSKNIDKLIEFAKEMMSVYGEEVSYLQKEESSAIMKIGADIFEIHETVEV